MNKSLKCVKKFNKNGETTKWYRIYLVLKMNGPMKKKEILDIVCPNRGYYDCFGKFSKPDDRGYYSDVFATMRRKRIIKYNYSTRQWSAGVIK